MPVRVKSSVNVHFKWVCADRKATVTQLTTLYDHGEQKIRSDRIIARMTQCTGVPNKACVHVYIALRMYYVTL